LRPGVLYQPVHVGHDVGVGDELPDRAGGEGILDVDDDQCSGHGSSLEPGAGPDQITSGPDAERSGQVSAGGSPKYAKWPWSMNDVISAMRSSRRVSTAIENGFDAAV